MKYDFRTLATLPNPPWHVLPAKANLVHDSFGLHLWCRNGEGCGVMLTDPHTEGIWRVRSRISPGVANPSTKVCLLLWPDGGKPWPPEIDFNESGDRTSSQQTLHYSDPPTAKLGEFGFNLMHHTGYRVDQTAWHTYGVEVRPGLIQYSCDGTATTQVTSDVPDGQPWNLHLRTQPNGHTDETHLDVRWMSYDA